MTRFPGKPSPALVVACIALVFAIAGTSIAATKIGEGDVGARELGKVSLRKATDLVDSQVDNHGEATANCKSGEQLLGGGTTFKAAHSDDYADIDLSGPKGKNGWFGGGYVDDSETEDFELVVTAICLAK